MKVWAAELWNAPKIRVQKDQRLSVSASGEWKDWGRPCGPEGYESERLKPFEALRRAPKARWLELIGCIDKRLDLSFPIGVRGQVVAPAAGEVYLFANDVWFMYWNNSGCIEVEITAVS